jgi:hydrogenase maturation protease
VSVDSPRAQALVVGLGSPDRGDDAVGPTIAGLVADRVAEHGPDGVLVVAREDPTALVDLMTGRRAVVIVDATRSGSPPGTVAVHDMRPDGPALPARTAPGPAGTHGLGLAASLELARALERLPARVTVVGVEAARFDHGVPLSESVAAAIPEAVARCIDSLAGLDWIDRPGD